MVFPLHAIRRGRWLPFGILCLTSWCLLSAWAAAKPSKSAKTIPGAQLFARDQVWDVKLEVPPASVESLRRDGRKQARATFIQGTNVIPNVGIHIKGSAGSVRGFDDKPALTVTFNCFVPDQRFHGLRRIHLNNSVQDPSYITENLCGELFRAAGVPAARATWATVRINDKRPEFYVLKEGFTKDFLSLYFTNRNGNLYDGGFLREITEPLERDGGDEDVKDGSDRKSLVNASRIPEPAKRWERLQEVLDVDRFLSFMVLENLTWDWDGYVQKPNNYRLYHDLDTGRMVFIPHGMDQMFWETQGGWNDSMNGLVARAIQDIPAGRQAYRTRYEQIFTNLFKLEAITNRVQQMTTTVTHGLESIKTNWARDYQGQAQRIRKLVNDRWHYLAKQFPVEQHFLRFENQTAKLTEWRKENENNGAQLERGTSKTTSLVLRIATMHPSVASWRCSVTLAAGRYVFEARAKAIRLDPQTDDKGTGAGLRIAASHEPRKNQLIGTTEWTQLSYPFTVEGAGEGIDLVCELRAKKGEVLFDGNSMILRKLP